MKVTLQTIAKESGFSITTVSRALAGYDDVNEATRQKIIEIATRLGYQPNQTARHLQSQRTDTIGLIIPQDEYSFADSFFSELMMGIGAMASTHHYDLLISSQIPGDDEMWAYRRLAGGNRVDGMVVARTRQNDPRLEFLKSIRHPFVVSGRLSPDKKSDFPYIDTDSELGIRMAVNHLTQLGHHHIGLILPPKEMAYTAYRFSGYSDGLSDAGIEYHDNYVVSGDLKPSGGYQMADYLLGQFPQMTAIIACNDLMAFGVMTAARKRGLKVGRDISVVGFDDIPTASTSDPPLTTIRQPIREIGERICEMLIQIIQGKHPEHEHVLLKPQLIVRESTNSR